ncbi:glucose-1-phosphate thymidylyltransferase [bacterium]|nr:glucose-1-phosphate thymidylyltransferase [candidate division CSSED10-310 bacterium]
MNETTDSNTMDFSVKYFFDINNIPLFKDTIHEDQLVWVLLDSLESRLKAFFEKSAVTAEPPAEFDYWRKPTREGGVENVITVRHGWIAQTDIVLPEWELFLGKGVILEPTVIIKTPAYIDRNTEVRQGAYIRGNVVIGADCTVGHNTEVKNSLFMRHTEAGHFAYIGDSLLGSYVNLGAGTKLANLPFRTHEQKKHIIFPELNMDLNNYKIDVKRFKFGAVIGDGSEIGCNSTLAPVTFIGPDSWIYPCIYLKKGFYPHRSIVKNPVIPPVAKKRADIPPA